MICVRHQNVNLGMGFIYAFPICIGFYHNTLLVEGLYVIRWNNRQKMQPYIKCAPPHYKNYCVIAANPVLCSHMTPATSLTAIQAPPSRLSYYGGVKESQYQYMDTLDTPIHDAGPTKSHIWFIAHGLNLQNIDDNFN